MMILYKSLTMSLCRQRLIPLLNTLCLKIAIKISLFGLFFFSNHRNIDRLPLLCHLCLWIYGCLYYWSSKNSAHQQRAVNPKWVHLYICLSIPHIGLHTYCSFDLYDTSYRRIPGFSKLDWVLEWSGTDSRNRMKYSEPRCCNNLPSGPSLHLFLFVLTTLCVQSIKTGQNKHSKYIAKMHLCAFVWGSRDGNVRQSVDCLIGRYKCWGEWSAVKLSTDLFLVSLWWFIKT